MTRRIRSLNTGEEITVPDWNGGFTRDEYKSFVNSLKKATISDFDYNESKDVDRPHISSTVDDIVANLRLFGLHEYYKEAYEDIIRYSEVGPDSDIARVDEAESPEQHLMYEAGEVLSQEVVRRVLEDQKK